jgi:hypothetical protein
MLIGKGESVEGLPSTHPAILTADTHTDNRIRPSLPPHREDPS